MIKLVIERRLLEGLVEQCMNYPSERIFVGVGTIEENKYRVEYVIECRNIAPKPSSRFVADPLCIFNVYRSAEEKGKEITTFIHNHPDRPMPSHEDLKGMKLWRIPWIIIDSFSGEYRAWIVFEEIPEEVHIEFI